MQDHYEDQMRGVLARTRKRPTSTRFGTLLPYTDNLDFDQVLLPFLAGMQGGVVGMAAAPVTIPQTYDWIFEPSADCRP